MPASIASVAERRKGSDYKQFVQEQFGKKTLTQAVTGLIEAGDKMLVDLAHDFDVGLSW